LSLEDAPGSHYSHPRTVEDHLRLEKRAGRQKCGVNLFRQLTKRDGPLAGRNVTLVGRDMTTPVNGDVESFIVSETDAANWQEARGFVAWSSQAGYNVNNAVFRRFRGQAFSYSLTGLAGCTALVIVSRQAVYVAHYWENIAFDMDAGIVPSYASQEDAFQESVIRGLQDGVVIDGMREQDSLHRNRRQFADEYVHAFLMIPATDTTNTVRDPYRDAWETIKQVVGGIIPLLQDPGRWTEYPYQPIQETDTIRDAFNNIVFNPWKTSRGRLLFKYEPYHGDYRKTLLITETTIQQSGSWEW